MACKAGSGSLAVCVRILNSVSHIWLLFLPVYTTFQILPAWGPLSPSSPTGFLCVCVCLHVKGSWKSESVGGEGLSSRGCQGNRPV